MRKKGGIEEGEKVFFFQICCGREEDRQRERESK